MPNLDARLSTVLMFTNCFIELIKRVKGGLKKLEAYLILKTIFLRNFYFQRINRFLPEWKFDFQKLRVFFQGTWIPETGKPTSPQLLNRVMSSGAKWGRCIRFRVTSSRCSGFQPKHSPWRSAIQAGEHGHMPRS